MALKSVPTKRFWKCYHSLPEHIRKVADEVYKLWNENPFDPVLEFHEIRKSLWRIKIGYRYRALARRYTYRNLLFLMQTITGYQSRGQLLNLSSFPSISPFPDTLFVVPGRAWPLLALNYSSKKLSPRLTYPVGI